MWRSSSANPCFPHATGPPGTNYAVMKKAFDEGWGGVIAKTVSVDSSKVTHRLYFAEWLLNGLLQALDLMLQVTNVTPRYAKLRSRDRQVSLL